MACSVDTVTFQLPAVPDDPIEDCAIAGDEDGNGAADCDDPACAQAPACAPTCTDGEQNGDETDVDCGGSCPACGVGKACATDQGCASFGVCDGQRCRAAASCDEVRARYPTAPDGAYSIAPATAREIFSGATVYVEPFPTFNTGGANWSTQPNCQRFGTNFTYGLSVRFGWTANQEPNCLSNDTVIGLGVGGYGAGYRCGSSNCSAGMVDVGGVGFLWGK